ncbi:MAG TPA: hypothetical protein VD931_18930 [Baekduia sp.]|nr:hypothetical protein [Baekduia sp.]
MSDPLNEVYETIDRQHTDKPAATRRQIVAGAAAALGSAGLLAVAETAAAQSALPQSRRNDEPNTPENIVNIAATAEVLATIVNTVGLERLGSQLDPTTRANIEAAAREELIHYEVLTSRTVGASPVTKRIWVPNAVFSSPSSLLSTLVTGDQIFINAYLLAVTVMGRAGGLAGSRFARISAEFMGVEAVHRALALQSLGRLGNDRAFMLFGQVETNPVDAFNGTGGFYRITDAVARLEKAGFGFGKEGASPGTFYDFDQVAARTPNPAGVTTRVPS